MALNGPILDDEKFADGLEWAHSCPSEKLPMTSNEPILAHGKRCLYP
jgi:hypothetical protein